MKLSQPRPAIIAEDLLLWLRSEFSEPLPADIAHEHYLLMHPRISYLKNLPQNSVVLDVGAGSGALRGFREWLGFKRLDLKFIGISLDHGEHTETYEEFHICDLSQESPKFELKPSDAVLAQFIEHVQDPGIFLKKLADVLPVGGTAFVDWPAAHTINLPKCADIRSHGFNITTLNFFDDSTHLKAYTIEEMSDYAAAAGFEVTAAGYVDMPYLANSLKYHGIKNQDQYLLSMAVWLKTNFVCYLRLEK
jgi:2-polyprenyl-3-methyl-5-hydroxy-6-metoxy-1,4-benzoquinol methylase